MGEAAQAGFSRAGAAAALVAAAEVAAALLWIAGGFAPPHGSALVVLIALYAGSVLVLTRLAMPPALRWGLVLGVVSVLLGMTARSDLLGVRAVSDSVSNTLENESAMAADAALERKPAHSNRTVARVQLRPAAEGDDGWAERLNQRIGEALGNGNAMAGTVTGSVAIAEAGADARLRIYWQVDSGAASARCGLMMVSARDRDFVVEQAAGMFGRALRRTAVKGMPSCY